VLRCDCFLKFLLNIVADFYKKRHNERYSPLRIQDVQVWVMAEWYSAPTVTQLLAQSAVCVLCFSVLMVCANSKVTPLGREVFKNKKLW
jgi:succinate dehydrogenase/fumarate reductase-like Fe-S protein